MELFYLTLHELKELLEKRQVSAEEVTSAVLARIHEVDSRIKAYLTFTEDEARKMAKDVDSKRRQGEALGCLAGIPAGLKDNLCTKGIRTTCASKILENFISPYDATVVQKLEAEMAVFTGKLNMDEFAMGSSTENSAFFPTCNPWNLGCVPGGSSGGAAAAVAAGEAVYALGSDTGGSIRQPASFCGIVGLKPTYGLVSRYGLVAFASSLDQIGPLTRDVRDAALVLNAIAGHDPLDSTSIKATLPDYTDYLVPEIKGLKIGIPREFFEEGLDPEVHKIFMEAVHKLEDLGAVVEECSLPHTVYALPCYYIIAPAEASSNLARYDGVRYGRRAKIEKEAKEDLLQMYMETRSEGFGTEVKRRIMLGTYALSAGYYDAYYLKALKIRTLIKQDFEKLFEHYDLLVSPTSPTTAFRFGEKAGDPLTMYLSDVYTIPVNLAGIPAISLPCGFAGEMPVGLQLIAPAFGEGKLFRVAYTFEQNTHFHLAKPSFRDAGDEGFSDGRIER